MNKKYLLIFVLCILLLGNAAAPFTLNDYHGDIIPVDNVDLKIENEEIVFNVTNNKIEATVKYEIVNDGNEKNIGFIFPVFSEYKDSFEIFFNNGEVEYEIVEASYLKEVLSDKWENLENIISQKNIIFIDPVQKNLYTPEMFNTFYKNNDRYFPNLYKFVLNFKKNSKNILLIKFSALPSEDRKLYPKSVYSYYYILNTKEYYKKFEDINIKIYYPKNYTFASNLKGEIKNIDDKCLYEIDLDEINDNLTFSYINSKISNFSIFLYKNFPIIYSSYFILILIFFLSIIIFIGIAAYLILKFVKRKKRNV